MIRFFTYGSTYDEWLDPSDVRKMGDVEIMRGLSGPTQPVTQRDFDGGGEGYSYGGGERGGSRPDLLADLMRSFQGGSGDRNRREDRERRGDTFKRDLRIRSDEESRREEPNWREYLNRQQGGNPNGGDSWQSQTNEGNGSGKMGRDAEGKRRNESTTNSSRSSFVRLRESI
jgi:hypothetical protein